MGLTWFTNEKIAETMWNPLSNLCFVIMAVTHQPTTTKHGST
jgi:hypothetical protein